MSGKWKEVVRLRFKGDRYRDHALDLTALKKLGQFQKMVAETAKELWRSANPDRERLPRHFDERTRLCLRKIEDGSATAPLEVFIDEEDQTSFLDPEAKEIEEAIELTYGVFEAVDKEQPLPKSFPQPLASEYARWAQEIEEGEEIEIQPPQKKQIRITAETAQRLAVFCEESHEDYVDLIGEVLEADVRQKQFQLWIDDKAKVLASFTEHQETEVTTALRDHNSVRMRIKGTAEINSQGKVLRIKTVEELTISPAKETDFDTSAKPIGQILEELGKEVPQEEWDNLPGDLTDNLDHHIYGTPKH
ncbi:MAG: hypothetical protein ACE5G9_05365 [Nitrospinales bacterium]